VHTHTHTHTHTRARARARARTNSRFWLDGQFYICLIHLFSELRKKPILFLYIELKTETRESKTYNSNQNKIITLYVHFLLI